MRSTLRSVICVGMISTALGGCGPVPIPHESLIQQRHPNEPGYTGPQVAKIGHLLTIESDFGGRSQPKLNFDLEFMADANNNLLLLNFHNRAVRGADLPAGAGLGTPEIREKFCKENALKNSDNCSADIGQLKASGIVIEDLGYFKRAAVVLKVDSGFSAIQGGMLVINYIEKVDPTNAAQEMTGELRLRLERSDQYWTIVSVPNLDKGAVGAIKINSSFGDGGFANGVESIQLGETPQNYW